jgi:hypothetical protein
MSRDALRTFNKTTHLNEAVVYEVSINEPLERDEKRGNDNWSRKDFGVFRRDDVFEFYQRTSEEENANRAAQQT